MGWLAGCAVVSASILLGITFTNWAVDHYVLWQPAPLEPDHFKAAIQYYHDVWLYPPYVALVVGFIYAIGAGAALISFLLGGTMNMLFDGASTLLYFASFAVYIRDIDPGLRSLNDATATETTHLVDLKTVASGHLSICVCLTGVLMLQTAQHFVVISSANDTPQASAAGTGAPASEASALPSPQLGALPKEKPLQPSASSTAMQAGPTRASTRKAKQEAQAALSVKPTPATATHGSDESSNESNSAAAATTGRVTRSKSAALKKSDSEVSDSASPTLKSPSSKKKKGTKSKKA